MKENIELFARYTFLTDQDNQRLRTLREWLLDGLDWGAVVHLAHNKAEDDLAAELRRVGYQDFVIDHFVADESLYATVTFGSVTPVGFWQTGVYSAVELASCIVCGLEEATKPKRSRKTKKLKVASI
jgi:hypothetical protein